MSDTAEIARQEALAMQAAMRSPAEQRMYDETRKAVAAIPEQNARDAIALGFGSDAFRIRYRHRFLAFDGMSLDSAEALVGRWVADELEKNRDNVRLWGFLNRSQMALRTIREVEAILRIIRADGLAPRFPLIVDTVNGFVTGFLREAAE
jgi:hypothetical protein